MKRLLVILCLTFGLCLAQYYKTLVSGTNSFDATGYNNSHKIAVKNLTKLNDTICVVYYSSDSVFYIYSTDEGYHWQNPVFISPGRHPAIDLDRNGYRHIVWEFPDTSAGTIDIYYDCLNDTLAPIKVNLANRLATMPDVVVDSALCAHIVWLEDVSGRRHIYYRKYSNGSLGDTMRLSNYGSALEDNTSPSISIFKPNKRIYVLWSSVDSSSYTPFRISCRYNEAGNWSEINLLYDHFRPLRNTSLDYSHGNDSLSACWEDSSSGNLEATFYGGTPGGGYPTAGLSRYPVVSTVSITWSYLFWAEDSLGFKDIHYHLYYCMTGWYGRGSIRSLFSINEPVRFPSACGAYVIWTQGNTPPYAIYFANFGYPIGIEDNLIHNTTEKSISAYPNPFQHVTTIKFATRNLKSAIALKIYDVSGKLVKNLIPATYYLLPSISVRWDGTDESGKIVPAGVYFINPEELNQPSFLNIVKIK